MQMQMHAFYLQGLRGRYNDSRVMVEACPMGAENVPPDEEHMLISNRMRK